MNQGRLPVEFRERTKRYASATIRLFAKLPKGRDEIRVLGKQFLRAGTSVAAHVRERRELARTKSSYPNLEAHCRKPDRNLKCGWSCLGKIAGLLR